MTRFFILGIVCGTIAGAAHAAEICGTIERNIIYTSNGGALCMPGTDTNPNNAIVPNQNYTYGCVNYSDINTTAHATALLMNCSWKESSYACSKTSFWNDVSCVRCPDGAGASASDGHKNTNCPYPTRCPSGTTLWDYSISGGHHFAHGIISGNVCRCDDSNTTRPLYASPNWGVGSGGCFPCPANAIYVNQYAGVGTVGGNSEALMFPGCFCPIDTYFNGYYCAPCPNGGKRRTKAAWNDSIEFCTVYGETEFEDDVGTFVLSGEAEPTTQEPQGCYCGGDNASRMGCTIYSYLPFDCPYDEKGSCHWSD